MSIKFEAIVARTSDNGYDFLDMVGSVVVHVDGAIVEQRSSEIKIDYLGEKTDKFAPAYSNVEIPDDLDITVQHWTISSTQSGSASSLLEFYDGDPDEELIVA
jgi:hypothetical protein